MVQFSFPSIGHYGVGDSIRRHKDSPLAPHLAAIFSWLRVLFGLTVLFALVGSAMAQQGAPSSSVGPTGKLIPLPDKPEAPNFTLTDTEGRSHTLADYRGKVVVVNFWSVWCAPCRKEMPSMQRAWEQVQNKGVLILAVNWNDDADEVAQFFAPIPVDFPVLLGGDNKMIKAWSVKGLPTTYIVDSQGRLVYRVVGEYQWDAPRVIDMLLTLSQ